MKLLERLPNYTLLRSLCKYLWTTFAFGLIYAVHIAIGIGVISYSCYHDRQSGQYDCRHLYRSFPRAYFLFFLTHGQVAIAAVCYLCTYWPIKIGPLPCSYREQWRPHYINTAIVCGCYFVFYPFVAFCVSYFFWSEDYLRPHIHVYIFHVINIAVVVGCRLHFYYYPQFNSIRLSGPKFDLPVPKQYLRNTTYYKRVALLLLICTSCACAGIGLKQHFWKEDMIENVLMYLEPTIVILVILVAVPHSLITNVQDIIKSNDKRKKCHKIIQTISFPKLNKRSNNVGVAAQPTLTQSC